MEIKFKFMREYRIHYHSGVYQTNSHEAALPQNSSTPPPAVLPIFLFGDSIFDVGTNNFVPECTAKANHQHHGIDFPKSEPTGRFSDGFNTADYLVKLMGHEMSPPPFLSLDKANSSFRDRILEGANFASAGSGILDSTGFGAYKSLGSSKAKEFLSRSLFLISVGGNDVLDYGRFNNTIGGFWVSPLSLIPMLISAYENHLKNLYHLGARRFGVVSMSPLGCCPYVRAQNNGECLQVANIFAQSFFDPMKNLLEQLAAKLPGMKYSLGNAYQMTMDIIQEPFTFNITEAAKACCGKGSFNGENRCDPDAQVCENREEYLFWDRFHPTQAVARFAARTLYGGSKNVVIPMNFSQLTQI
ncbi:GDSL esterase/lipase At5g33370-like [Tripterygium wilfordii]|uniref:GDSL esterase/lipase At5g33370-like n=1 Tax=Tripterygium wilfordii TaxID=458696 RepID=UPI0018F862FE|nr:GDSL esterase/lipase At5g33370-like [Tripterygium wilfordii]